MEIVGVVVCTVRVVKRKEHQLLCRNFVLNIELLFTVLSNFEREAAFQYVTCLTNEVLLFVYSLVINLIGLTYGLVYPIIMACDRMGSEEIEKSIKNMMRIELKRG